MNRKEIEDLFQNPKFQEASICFYDERRSVIDVEELSGVSRTTIYKFFDRFKTKKITVNGREIEDYDADYLNYRGLRKKNYLFTQKILVDWISSEIDLTKEEEEALTKILEKEGVDKALRKGNESWSDVKTKLMLPLVVLLPVSEETGLGKEFAFRKVPNQINALHGLTRKETDEYIRGLQDSIQELEDPVIEKLVDKFTRADLSISLYMSDLQNIIMDTARSAVTLLLNLVSIKELERTRKGKQVINRISKNLQRMYGLKRKEIRKKLNSKF